MRLLVTGAWLVLVLVTAGCASGASDEDSSSSDGGGSGATGVGGGAGSPAAGTGATAGSAVTGGTAGTGGTGETGGSGGGTGGEATGATGGETTAGTGGTGGSSATGGTAGTGGAPTPPGNPTLPDGRGATVPWVEYEAEDAETNGTVLGPSRTYTTVEAESSGRRAVRLDAQGQYVRFTAESQANSLVVRYSVPDQGDWWGTLSVYVNDEFRTRINVTSRYSWTYGPHTSNGNGSNDPGTGTPHHFYDESRTLAIGDVPAGATVMLRKDAEDTAPYYVIDLIDLEQVGGPLPRPDGYRAITDGECGAVPDDGIDDAAAIQNCIDQVRGNGVGLYIPPGNFIVDGDALSVGAITIRGAGMWHSTLYGSNARFDCWDDDCQYYDFSLLGETTVRDDRAADTCFGGNGSSRVVLDGIWMEHCKTGYWVGARADALAIRNSRIRNLMADGVNLYGGATNCIIENNHARNTGDDAFAIWSHNANGNPNGTNNTIRHNYVQLPWMANCFAAYGGDSNHFEDNVCADTVQYPGMLFARGFDSHAFAGTTTVDRNTLIRAGGNAYDQPHGALKIHADQGPVQNLAITGLDIWDATNSAIHLQGDEFIDTVYFDGVSILGAGGPAWFLNWGSNGACDAANVVAESVAGGVQNDSDGNFTIIRGDGNSGW